MISGFAWADFRSTNAGIKAHVALDLRGAIPVLLTLTSAKVGDSSQLDTLHLPKGSIVVLDRGYIDFARLYGLTLRGKRFVNAPTCLELVFLTDRLDLPALTIAPIYKQRWQVELFFKWFKLDVDLCTLMHLLELNLFEKIPIEQMVRMAIQPDNAPSASYQWALFR